MNLRVAGTLAAVLLVAAGLALVAWGVQQRAAAEPPGTVAMEGGGAKVRSLAIAAEPLPSTLRQGAAQRTFGVVLAASGLAALLCLALFAGNGSGAGSGHRRVIGAAAVGLGGYGLYRLAVGVGPAALTAGAAEGELRVWAPATALLALLAAARA